MYFTRTPAYLKSLFGGLTWDVPETDAIFLTFDDGPVPGVTDKVLDMLAASEVKATFFCIGHNVQKHPELYRRILDEGHAVGNHTFHHLNGWRSNDETYLEDVEKCADLVSSRLFRPPYGRIGYRQMQLLKQQYRIIMWDVLSGDFDELLTADDCANNVLSGMRGGSIIVWHDSEKAAPRMLPALERVLHTIRIRTLRTETLRG
ncbi:MAG: polysaccharide deacetylase family protein [Chitinophagales bacterium]|nr:polysaccharide deacetylase family protein [Chitinophagales bacterium]MCB9021469.1 polysaccharide deacetylase family protein [Chitinophagales bacterium]MCB9032014.1 polysaccharide deacetylase family protein [Chitinophagales bacterium]HPR28682.1 polysaccharide deacetylase family protein [Chitinophagales bacterium]HQU39169.1 polysaccharide deacetylase family protein [Chitinophagales bacterium]